MAEAAKTETMTIPLRQLGQAYTSCIRSLAGAIPVAVELGVEAPHQLVLPLDPNLASRHIEERQIRS